MTDNRLPLADSEWNRLKTFGKTPEPLNVLVSKALNDPLDPANPALDYLGFAIFDEYYLVEASYAVFPYLIEISERYKETNPQIYFLAANIAAATLDDRTVVSERVHQGFFEALPQFESMACARLTTSTQFAYDEIVAALAFARHCAGKLLMDVFENDGGKHTGVLCTRCGERTAFAVLNEGTASLIDGEYPPPPDPPMPLPPPIAAAYPQRDPNPWTPIADFLTDRLQGLNDPSVERKHVDVAIRLCRSGVTPQVPMEHVASLIGSILLAHGSGDRARRFYRFWDNITCPKCGNTFMLAQGWWGCRA